MIKYYKVKIKIISSGGYIMSKICSVCGKGKLSGNLVSHSNRKTPKSYEANLQKVYYKKEDGTVVHDYVCTRCLKKIERA